jgi:hypothetical protein
MTTVTPDKKQENTPQDMCPPASLAQINPAALPKTTGEKYYGVMKFAVAEAVIVAVTAVTAYWALYSKRTALNIFGHIQSGMEKLISYTPLRRLGKEGSSLRKHGIIAAELALGTTATFHGGNAFAPIMKWFDNHKVGIVRHFNKKFGEPGEVEIGDERLKNAPKQTWGDIIKGRLLSWLTVFTALSSAVFLLPSSKENGRSHFGNFEEKFGRWFAGFTKDGKELSEMSVYKVPRLKETHPHLAENKAYRFGKILAIDIYATAAAIIIWNVFSEFSARSRHNKQKEAAAKLAPETTIAQTQVEESLITPNHTAMIKPRATQHADAITIQRDMAETQSPQLGA